MYQNGILLLYAIEYKVQYIWVYILQNLTEGEMYAENLKNIRKSLRLSVAKFAELLEMSASTLTGYERSERTPSWQLFAQLYKKANVNLNWFVSGEGEMFLSSQNFASEYESVKNDILKEVRKMFKEKGL